MSESVCKGDHTGHLCVLVSEQKFDEIKQLVKNPQYICFHWRPTAERRNL